VNHVSLVGQVLRPPTTRFEGAGVQVTDFTVSVAEPSTSSERKPYSVFIGCTAWGRSAEACSLLQTSDVVEVQGRLTWHRRKHKCGQEHAGLCVSVKEIHVVQQVLAPVLANHN